MNDLFPTAAEVDQAYGPGVNLRKPVLSPPAPETATATPTLDPGLPEQCRAAYLGNDESRSIDVDITRGLLMMGDASDPSRILRWALSQLPSSDEAKRSVTIMRSAYAPCPIAKTFDLGTENGFGATLALADGSIFSVGLVAVGDVTMTISIVAREEYQDAIRRMAATVERRLQEANEANH